MDKACECGCGRALTAAQMKDGRRFASRRCAKVVTQPRTTRANWVTAHWKGDR